MNYYDASIEKLSAIVRNEFNEPDQTQIYAILKDFVVIPHSDLPEIKSVEVDREGVAGFQFANDNIVFQSSDNGYKWVCHDIAAWLRFQELDLEKLKEETLKDKLAQELTGQPGTAYARVEDSLKRAILMIIEKDKK